MDRGAWWSYSPRGPRESDTTEHSLTGLDIILVTEQEGRDPAVTHHRVFLNSGKSSLAQEAEVNAGEAVAQQPQIHGIF